jgi:hypothetical protein
MAYYTAGIVGSYFRDAVTPNGFDISGSTVSASNFLMASGGRFRDTSGNIDISGGNLTVVGTITAGAISSSGIAPTNIVVPGYIRDNIVSPNMDISGGNIRIAGRMTNGPGSVSAPSYTFVNDVSMGLYDPATNVLGIVTSGVERMRVASNGNVGIGTTSPGELLDVVGGNIQTTGQLMFNSADTEKIFFTTVDGSGSKISHSSPWQLDITAGAPTSNSGTTRIFRGTPSGYTETARFDSNGRLGIGTTTPAYSLDVGGTTQTTNAIVTGYLRNNLGASQFDISGGNINLAGTITGSTVNTNNSIGGVTLSNSDISMSPTGRILAPILRNDLGASQFDISGGNIRNVGQIQTGSGYSIAVDASDTITAFSNIRTHAGGFIGVSESQYLVNGAEWPLLRSYTFSNGIWTYKTATTTGGLIFKTRISGTTAERMRIGSNGFLGIGTSAPAYLLDVSGGDIGNTGRILTGAGTAAAPAHSFTADASMGLYDAGTNILGFATSGTQRLTIDACGNINNNNLFYFWSNSNLPGSAAQALHFGGTSGSPVSGRILFGDGTGWQMRFAQRNTTTTDLVTIDDRARLGIGVQNPAFALDISGMLSSDGVRIIAANPTIDMYVRGTETSVSVMRMFANATTGGLAQFDSGRSLSLIHGINSTQRLTITPAGNIGIGANHTAPELALDVSASAQYTAAFRGSGGTQAGIWVVNGAGVGTTTGIQMYQNANGQGLFTASGNAQPMHFWTNGAIRASIASAGNVGIGTTAPAFRVDVSTDISLASVNMNTWPRFGGSTMYSGTYSSRNTDVINWTTVTSIDTTHLMSVNTGGGAGTYYIIKKSGFWHMSFRTSGPSTTNWAYGIGFKNDISWASGSYSSNLTGQNLFGNGEGGAFASFTGYLPSNNNTTYKVWVSSGNTPSTGTIVIAFLGESPTTLTGFPV